MVRPLLDLEDKTYAALSQLTQIGEPSLRLGLSTAFEQGVFAALESQLTTHVQKRHIVRHGSPELARLVRRGKLDAALVALPLETSGLSVTPLGWQESLIVALPALWPEAALPSLSLMSLSHRPLFWFKRERNPAFLITPDTFLVVPVTLLPVLKNRWNMMCCWRGSRRVKV